MAPLEKPVEARILPGVESTADHVGWALIGISAVGMGVHAFYSYFKGKKMGYKKECCSEHEKEE